MAFIQTVTNLKKYFSADAVAVRLKTLQPIKTTIMDLVFTDRRQHPSSVIGLDEVTESTGVVPMIRRGSRSYPVDQDAGSLQFLDPQPITPSVFAKASELNDMFAAGQRTTIQAWVDGKIEKLRRICRKTTEVLCAQSLTGSIAYKMITESGVLVNYSVVYGNTLSLTDVDVTSATLAKFIEYFEAIYQALQAKGYSGDIRYLVGNDVYTKLAEIIIAAKNAPARFVDYGIELLAKYKLMPMGETFVLPGASTPTYVVPPKKVCAIDIQAPFVLFYCALDDLDANLQPMPFYAKPIPSEDPSGVKIVGNSKPLPAPVLNALLWQTMLPG